MVRTNGADNGANYMSIRRKGYGWIGDNHWKLVHICKSHVWRGYYGTSRGDFFQKKKTKKNMLRHYNRL